MSKVDVNNCLVFYYLSNVFDHSVTGKALTGLVQSCFSMFSETTNFLELDFISLRKILSSDQLNVDTELQVFNAADSWLCHDLTKRRDYANNILCKVRLSLLSVAALKQILDNKQYSIEFNEFSKSIKYILSNKQQLNLMKCNTKTRYCTHNNFDIILCGGRYLISNGYFFTKARTVNDVRSLDAQNFTEVKNMQPMRQARDSFDAFCIKGEVFVIGGFDYDENIVRSIEKYSPVTNTWEDVTEISRDRSFFAACSFMDSIYIVGGVVGYSSTNTCVEFCTKTLKWHNISNMNGERTKAACTVFEGRVVVSGGFRNLNSNDISNTVEAYDHVANAWFKLPDMIERRYCHKSVSVKNKLFLVGGVSVDTCEVFNSNTNKFCLLKELKEIFKNSLSYLTEVISIGTKLSIFGNKGHVIVYDIDKDEWSEKTCEAIKNLLSFSCVKLPVKSF